MAKVRIYELAKKLGYVNKTFVEELAKEGIEVKSHMSTVDEETAELIMTLFSQQAPAPKTPKEKAKAAPKKKAAAPKAKAAAPAKKEEKPAKKKAAPAKSQKTKAAPPPAEEKAAPPPAVEDEASPAAAEAPAPEKKPEPEAKPPRPTQKIQIPEAIVVKDLAEKLSLKATEVIKELMKLGHMTTINQMIDSETAEIICAEFGFEVEVKKEAYDELPEEKEDMPEDLMPRRPDHQLIQVASRVGISHDRWQWTVQHRKGTEWRPLYHATDKYVLMILLIRDGAGRKPSWRNHAPKIGSPDPI